MKKAKKRKNRKKKLITEYNNVHVLNATEMYT